MAHPAETPEETTAAKESSRPPPPAAREGRPAPSNGRPEHRAQWGRREAPSGRRSPSGPDHKDGAGRKPTPVRAMTGSEPGRSVAEPDPEEVRFQLDGEEWRARVLGRSGAGRRGATPLLLVGFSRADGGADETDGEVYIVGRSLADTTIETLERALREVRMPPGALGEE
jgi:hypothetical protein